MNADINLSWLHTFDKDELIELVNEIIYTVNKRYDSPNQSNCLTNIESILQEWKESAIAINCPEIKQTFFTNL